MAAANQAKENKKKAKDAKTKQAREAKRLMLHEAVVVSTLQDASSRETDGVVISLPDTAGTESPVAEDLSASIDSSVYTGSVSFQTSSLTTNTGDISADVTAPVVASG